MKWSCLMKGTLSCSPIITKFASCFQNNEYTSLSTPTPTPTPPSLPPLSLMTVNNNEEFMTLVSSKCSIVSLPISERCTVNGISSWSSCTLEGPGQGFPSSCKTLDGVTVSWADSSGPLTTVLLIEEFPSSHNTPNAATLSRTVSLQKAAWKWATRSSLISSRYTGEVLTLPFFFFQIQFFGCSCFSTIS